MCLWSEPAAVAATVHDRTTQSAASGRTYVQGKNRLHQHHGRRPATGNAVSITV